MVLVYHYNNIINNNDLSSVNSNLSNIKAGNIAITFTGSETANLTITFSSPFPDNNYALIVTQSLWLWILDDITVVKKYK